MAATGAPAVVRSARFSVLRLPPRTYVQAGLCAVGVMITATTYESFFASPSYLIALALCTAVATVAALAASAAPSGMITTVLTGLIGFVATAIPVLLPGTLRGGLSEDLSAAWAGWSALTGGWAAMLSIGTPVAPSAQMLMTPALVCWTIAFIATTATLRSRSIVTPALILLPAEMTGLLFVANRPDSHVLSATALLVVALGLCLLRAGGNVPSAGRTGRGYLTVRAMVPAVAAVGGLLVGLFGPFADGQHRFDPRSLLPLALDVKPVVSPLSQVRPQLGRTPAQLLFTVTITAPARSHVDRIQTATLDDFDGARWTSSDDFMVSGPTLTPGPATPNAVPVTEHVALSQLPGPFLPIVGRPSFVSAQLPGGARLGFAGKSGDLVTDSTGLNDITYDAVSATPNIDAGLRHALAGTGPSYARYTTLPPVPVRIAAMDSDIVARATGTGPYAKLTAIAAYLRQLPYNVDAPPGESYGMLLRMLYPADPRQQASGVEQHATAFAVLARDQGVPTRIAVGYLLRGGHRNTYTVTTADAYAWPQAYFQGYGWVDFDPTDPNRVAPPSLDNRTRVPVTDTPPTKPTPPSKASSTRSAHGQPGEGWGGILLTGTGYASAGLFVAAMLAEIVNVAAKFRRRRHRRRRAGTARRVAGAWLEALDRLQENGVRIPDTLTTEQITQQVAKTDAGTRGGRTLFGVARTLAELAPLADRAVYGGALPNDGAAERAWEIEHRLRRELYPGRLPVRRAIDRLKVIRRTATARGENKDART